MDLYPFIFWNVYSNLYLFDLFFILVHNVLLMSWDW